MSTKLTEAGKKVWEKPYHPKELTHYQYIFDADLDTDVLHDHKAMEFEGGITYGEWLVGQALGGMLSNKDHGMHFNADDDAQYVKEIAIATCNKLGEVNHDR